MIEVICLKDTFGCIVGKTYNSILKYDQFNNKILNYRK